MSPEHGKRGCRRRRLELSDEVGGLKVGKERRVKRLEESDAQEGDGVVSGSSVQDESGIGVEEWGRQRGREGA